MQFRVDTSGGKCMSHVKEQSQHVSSFPCNWLTRASEEALQKHRMQGHVPYDPRCTICARGKSVFQHRRRRAGLFETEIKADFAFLITRGEVVSEETAQ